jgi:hypothetical protein
MLENMRQKKLDEMGSLASSYEPSEFYDEVQDKRDTRLRKRSSTYKDHIMNNFIDRVSETGEHILILKDNNVHRSPLNNSSSRRSRDIDENDVPHIDFFKYCNIMKLFNIKYPVDCKIDCIILLTNSLL